MRSFLYLTSIIVSLSLLSCGGSKPEAAHGDGDAEIQSQNVEAETPEKKEPKIVGEEISYNADGVTMNGYLAYDANQHEKRPGIVVVHEWWGHNEHTRNAAERLAKEGYVAFAVDMYGDGKQADHPGDAKAFSGAVMSSFKGAQDRFNAAMDILKSNKAVNNEEIGAIGYCFGGGVVLNMARQGADLDAVATFHGSIGPIEEMKPNVFDGEILVLNGAADPFVPREAVSAFKEEMKAANVPFSFVDYPGAKHAFTNPAATAKGEEFGLPLEYNEEVSEKAWERCMKFFESVFGE